ncbi:MAG: HAD family hydrolase [Rhodothermales bacterium]
MTLHREIVLLDMNGTFMFGGDRFGPDEDYWLAYREFGGTRDRDTVNRSIKTVFDHLAVRYNDPGFFDSFPRVEEALAVVNPGLSDDEVGRLAAVFARHELGRIPDEYSEAVRALATRHRLGIVGDIWAEKSLWIDELDRAGILHLFEAVVISSDIGSVKPSPALMRTALRIMKAEPDDAIVIGDSAFRDGGGALAAGVPFILVGGQRHHVALAHASSLLELV